MEEDHATKEDTMIIEQDVDLTDNIQLLKRNLLEGEPRRDRPFSTLPVIKEVISLM